MKLSTSVLDAVRGLAGAALVSAVAAGPGCGAAPPRTTPPITSVAAPLGIAGSARNANATRVHVVNEELQRRTVIQLENITVIGCGRG